MDLPLNLDPAWISTTVLGFIALIECVLLLKVMGVLRAFAKMYVLYTRITSDRKVVLNEPDIPAFVDASMAMLEQMEGLLSWLFGYIVNHPSTGWIAGYGPQIKTGVNAAVQQLAKEAPDSQYTVETVTSEPITKPQTETVGQPG